MTVSVTATPDSLTLVPGESAQVTVMVDPASPYGSGSVTIPVTVPAPYDETIEGNFGGTVPAGQHWHVTGDVNQTGDVFVEGLLTGVETFRWQGNGFSVFFQNGGRADLHGKFKAAWGPWGTDATGWLPGDRLAVAPTAAGVYVPSELVWSDWSMPRPINSPDFIHPLLVAKPEVVNLSQSIVFENLARGFHFHDSAGVQSMSDVKFLNCGTTGILGNYPCHFHLLGENSRGSLLERVVAEGGKNHAFVPHGSHGITFKDCVAYRTANDAFWWDDSVGDPLNLSNDVTYDHCLGLGVNAAVGSPPGQKVSLTAFLLQAGTGNRIFDSVGVGVDGGISASGFHWPSKANQQPNLWESHDLLAHNNKANGIFVWQNDPHSHVVERFTAFNNHSVGIDHGAYNNRYAYRDITITGSPVAVRLHALGHPNAGPQIWERVHTDGPLLVFSHNQTSPFPTVIRESTFTGVTYEEWKASNPPGSGNPSEIHYEDCGLIPTDFTLTRIHSGSVIELWEDGVLAHRWATGWS